MIELVVAMFVFAIGLLGFAALQTRSLQEGFDSSQRSLAIWRLQELADRVRANADAVNAYVNAVNSANICDAAPAPRCADYYTGAPVAGAVCTANELALFDTWDVVCNGDDAAITSLVDMDISLACTDADPVDADPCSPGSSLQLNMSWSSRSATGDDQIADDAPAITQQYLLNFRP